MKTITRLGSIIAVFTLLTTLAPAATAAERARSKYFKVAGKVIQIDKKERTLLVTDSLSKTLYLIEVPELATFKITFGRYMRMAEPGFEDVRVGERVEIRCKRNDPDRLAQLDDGRLAIPLIATR
jgi:hypothetical protein